MWFIDCGLITHKFTVGNLQAETGWTGFISLIGVLLLLGGGFSIYLLRKKKIDAGFKLMAASSLVFIYLTVVFIVPGVEKYSQNAEIEFFKSLKGKDVYSQTFYKSYAMLFYTGAEPTENTDAHNLDWLLSGEIDKDAWFVIRADKKDNILNYYKSLEVVYEKNGYVFCLRRKP